MVKTFIPLSFDSSNIGRRIKSSKKKYTWKFELDQHIHTVVMFVSRISGKHRILLDDNIVVKARKSGHYISRYSFHIGLHRIVAYEISDSVFDLECNSVSFKKLYESQNATSEEYRASGSQSPKKKKQEFVYEDWDQEWTDYSPKPKRFSIVQEPKKPSAPKVPRSPPARFQETFSFKEKPEPVDLLDSQPSQLPQDLFSNHPRTNSIGHSNENFIGSPRNQAPRNPFEVASSPVKNQQVLVPNLSIPQFNTGFAPQAMQWNHLQAMQAFMMSNQYMTQNPQPPFQ